MAQSSWEAHHEHVKEKGLLAKKLYVVLTKPASGMEAVIENLQEHLKYQLELEANGAMFAAGPFADDEEQEWEGEGMVILRADSLEEAKNIPDDRIEAGIEGFPPARSHYIGEAKEALVNALEDYEAKK